MFWLLWQADWQALADIFRSLSLPGLAAILCIYPVAILFDCIAWDPYLKAARQGWRWLMQLCKIQIIADAVFYITPLGMAGGEAAKALILNRRHGIGYGDAIASLINLQLLLAITQIPFVIIGMAIMLQRDILPLVWRNGLLLAIAAITLFMFVLLLAIHKRWLRNVFKSVNEASRWKVAISSIEQQISELLVDRQRLARALLFTFLNWASFAAELWLISHVAGKPISFADAWAIESLIALARAATFFIPGHLGAQEGAASFAFKIFYGDPVFGLAVALVRRARELVWALIALPLGLNDFRVARANPPVSRP